MPPSWLQRLSIDHSGSGKSLLPDLEHLDWSRGLSSADGSAAARATNPFAEGLLSTSDIALHGEVCAFAFEPVLGYLAVGTTTGGIHLFGKEAVRIDWNLRPANKVSHLLFKSGSALLIVIDVKDNVSIFDLSRNDPQVRAKTHASPHPFQPVPSTTSGAGPSGPLHPDTPLRIGALTARNSVLCAEVSPLHNHLFIGLRDGTVDTYDLERLQSSPYKVPNLWWEEEEILRKSGVPDAPSRRHVPLVIDIQTHPNDVNQLLLAYEGGVALLDVIKRTVLRTFQLRHLPGAPGACVGDPDSVWTERAAPATCIAWRPDGLVFACGHEDGCISFWHIEDDEKPITVRTLERRDVDKPATMSESDYDRQRPQTREPIFKLSWSGLPAQSWLAMAQHAATTPTTASSATTPASPKGKEEEPATGTILTALGGGTELDPPGVVCFHFPAFSWPYSSYWNSKAPEAIAKTRQALQTSLVETKGSRYLTSAPVEDFLLLPRDSPYYGLAYDPTAIVMLLGADPRLPPLPPPAAARGLRAFAFPPPASQNDPYASLVGSPVVGQSTQGHTTDFSIVPQRSLSLPLALSTSGSGAILGAKLVDVTPHVYRNLTANDALVDEVSARREAMAATTSNFASPHSQSFVPSALNKTTNASSSDTAKLDLHGGRAAPTVSGGPAQTADQFSTLARAQRWRLLITWHLDGTVRFHDASPQLLLLGQDQTPTSKGNDDHQNFTPGFLQKGFPSPLPHLTVNVRTLVNNSTMSGHPLFERLRSDPARLRIVNVHYAPEATELAITLRSGQVVHYKFGFARYSETDEVEQDEEAAERMAFTHQRRKSAISGHSIPQATMANLDRSMAGAMHDLDIDPQAHAQQHSSPLGSPRGTIGSPPQRPKRDPKRLSALQNGGGLSPSASTSGLRDRVPSQAPLGHSPAPSPHPAAHDFSMPLDEITLVGHLASWRADGFKPTIIVELNRGEVTAVGLSDIGFLTVACGPALAVIDLRGPRIIVRQGFGGQYEAQQAKDASMTREERKICEEESKSAVQHVVFTVCRTLATPILSPTMIVVRESGYTTFWTLTKQPGYEEWMCARSYGHQLDELQHSGNGGVQVLDMAGNISTAVPAELQRSLHEHSRSADRDTARTMAHEALSDVSLMLCIGRQSLSLRAGVTGARIAKADVSGNDAIRAASVIDRRGEKVCLVVTLKSLFIYSLPHLNLITRVQRHNRAHEERLSIAQACISLDGSGDFIEVVNSLDVCMWTVFASMPRPGLPSLLLYTPPSMPIAPNALGSMASSVVNWIGGKSTAWTQGAQLDEALGGGAAKRAQAPMPKLPEPKYLLEKAEERERRAMEQDELSKRSADEAAYQRMRSNAGQGPAVRPTRVDAAAQQANTAQGTAAWTFDLAKQRGEMVNSLEQGLSQLEQGASNWMKSAREDMIKQAAKDKLKKFF